MIGSTLSHFEVTAKLGEGGMGEVFRARDHRLDRDVAIKILPSDVTEDPERAARFEREAKILASLSHPHVASIFEVREENGVHFLAMELVEGEDLARRLERGPLATDDAVSIALQIANGLEAAHQRGIVHRDLKPGNIAVGAGPDEVKLLDFGLAKAVDASSSEDADLTRSPTLTANMTLAGIVLGTAAYMSPEQARGRAVDRRTDIWAFGCILFEMLSGRHAFEGEDVAGILAHVIQGEPDWSSLPRTTPPRLRALLERCLRKDPRYRLRDIGDAWIELDEVARGGSVDQDETPVTQPPSTLHRWLPWGVAAALGIALLSTLGLEPREQTEPRVRRFAIDLPWHAVPNWTDFVAVISPSGEHIAYNGRIGNRVEAYVRSLDELEARPVAPARETTALAFSPDGSWLAVLNGSDLSKVPVGGGPVTHLADLTGHREIDRYSGALDAFGLSWGPRDDLLIATSAGVLSVPASGGSPQPVTRASAREGHAHPHHLPDGRHALVTIYPQTGSPTTSVLDLDTGELSPLSLRGSRAVYAQTGHLLFDQQGTTMAARFDASNLTLHGSPVSVVENVKWGPFIGADGTLLYVPERGEASARIVWTDRSGRTTPVNDDWRDYSHLDLATSGQKAVVNVASDVFALDLRSGTRQKLAASALFPIFNADDTMATTHRSPERIFVQNADGGGEATILLDPSSAEGNREDQPVGTLVPTSWNARTGELAFFDDRSDIWILDPQGKARPFLDSDANERTGRFSQDGRWLAYVSNETGEYQVYVVGYPEPSRRVPASIDGGLSPIWSPDGGELLFRNGGKLLSVEVTYEPELTLGAPVELFEGPYTVDLMGHQRWDVAPDGRRFLMVESSADFRIVVVENAFQELERLAPTGR